MLNRQTDNQSINASTNWSFNQSTYQSINQYINQSVNQSVSEAIHLGLKSEGSADLYQVAGVPVQLSKDDALRCCQGDAHLQSHQHLIHHLNVLLQSSHCVWHTKPAPVRNIQPWLKTYSSWRCRSVTKLQRDSRFKIWTQTQKCMVTSIRSLYLSETS